MSGPVVLVVDDEPQILRAVERTLTARGYVVRTASDGRAAVGAVLDDEPDLVVLDLNLPHVDGLTACREIRRSSRVPILVLSVRDAEEDKVAALDLGADDYLTKPFGAAELLGAGSRAPASSGARAHRHDGSSTRTRRSTSPRGRVQRGDAVVHLTPTEWRLLEALASAPGVLRTHDWLLGHVWEPGRRARRRGAAGVREPAPTRSSRPIRGVRG